MATTLNLGLIGNGQVGALIDDSSEIMWWCIPRFDGDPAFCSLLQPKGSLSESGYCKVELLEQVSTKQQYIPNSAVLVTRMTDKSGATIEVTDFAPRFQQYGRSFTPMMIIRQIRKIAGNPRVYLKIRPVYGYAKGSCSTTCGSHHIRYVSPDWVLRLTTNASITCILEETAFIVDDQITLVFGPDETIQEGVCEMSRRFLEETLGYWHEWVRDLAIPFEWQDEVIRAAITLQLNAFEDTGAIVAAMTTSIPEAAGSKRNWDYRFCWLRDAYFVTNTLNRLGTTKTMERYLSYLVNVVAGIPETRLQPVYGIDGRACLEEKEIDTLSGYKSMGPVRVGNQAYQQIQHDVYGSAILAVIHIFFDNRLVSHGDKTLFEHLERLGKAAIHVYDKPDAGIWELRGKKSVHTFSSIMCWAACDRLAKIAQRLGLEDRHSFWHAHAATVHALICKSAWNNEIKSFVGSFGGEHLDASLLLIHELGFLPAHDPRFIATVDAIERELKRGDFIYRYVEADDFGIPENAFVICSYWYIYALVALGRTTEARSLFAKLLACNNSLGLQAEHIDPRTGTLWGNYVQTYSMVGLINAAIRLSKRWDEAF